jgi:hypothetical protein
MTERSSDKGMHPAITSIRKIGVVTNYLLFRSLLKSSRGEPPAHAPVHPSRMLSGSAHACARVRLFFDMRLRGCCSGGHETDPPCLPLFLGVLVVKIRKRHRGGFALLRLISLSYGAPPGGRPGARICVNLCPSVAKAPIGRSSQVQPSQG